VRHIRYRQDPRDDALVAMAPRHLVTLRNLAALRDGDTIVIDAQGRRLDVELGEQELKARLARWTQPAPRYPTGAMAKYAKMVSSASAGAVTS